MAASKRQKMLILGILLLFIGGYFAGVWEKILIEGDTKYYLKTIGGYAGTAAGMLILEHAILRSD
ncbi:MAG: hypothetical protein ACLFT7_08695 [Thermoplasmata archaeon]